MINPFALAKDCSVELALKGSILNPLIMMVKNRSEISSVLCIITTSYFLVLW